MSAYKEGIETAYRDAPLPVKNQALQRHGFEPVPAPQAQHERSQAFLERIERDSQSVKAQSPSLPHAFLDRLEGQGKIKPEGKVQENTQGNDRQNEAVKDRGFDFDRD